MSAVVILWFAFGAIFGVWNVFQSPGLDFRLVAVGAVLPLAHRPAVRRAGVRAHVLAAVVVLAVAMLATIGRGRRLRRRRALEPRDRLVRGLVLSGVVGAQGSVLVAGVRLRRPDAPLLPPWPVVRRRGAARARGRVVDVDALRSRATPTGGASSSAPAG